MKHPRTEPSNLITIEWYEVQKKWRVTVRCWTGNGWARYWRWAETTHELDQLGAKNLLTAVTREMESWLPW